VQWQRPSDFPEIGRPEEQQNGTQPMPINYESVVTQSLAKQIAENIREGILRGDLKVEERLPTEEELAARFSVSRPTIREALKRLAAQNLVRSQRGPAGGTFVKRPSQEEVRATLTSATTLLVSLGEFDFSAIVEARHELERLCCRLAVQRCEDTHLDAMSREIEVQQSEISDEKFCASDVRFHRALVDATGNPVLQFVMFAVIEALQPVANMVVFRLRQRDKVIEQHRRILAAIRERDEAAALAALDEQMEHMREQYAVAQEARGGRLR
jgi:DNA-binding FadR family transcriptional regulator